MYEGVMARPNSNDYLRPGAKKGGSNAAINLENAHKQAVKVNEDLERSSPRNWSSQSKAPDIEPS